MSGIVEILLIPVHREGGELEAQLIDGEVVLPGMILQCPSEEAYRMKKEWREGASSPEYMHCIKY